MALRNRVGRKAAGGGDESAARVDASYEQPVKPKTSDFTPPRGNGRREWRQKTFSSDRQRHSLTSPSLPELGLLLTSARVPG